MKKYSFFPLIFFYSFILYGQRDMKSGYIITNNSDTVYGQIDYQLDVYNAENCYFIQDSQTNPITYKPGQIKAYRIINGKFYVSRKVTIEKTEREVFLEFLVNGKVDMFYLPPKYYFVEREDKGIHILENTEKKVVKENKEYIKENKEYIGILSTYMFDDLPIMNNIQKSNLAQKDLIKIATDYHNRVCPDEKCTVYTKESVKNIYRLGYAVGCNYNILYMSSSQSDDNGKNWAPGLMTGLELNYYTKGVRERFSFTMGLYYSQVKQNILFSQPSYRSDIEIEFLSKNLLVDAYFAYTYPKYKIKPYVGLGIFYFRTLKSSENLSEYFAYNPEKKSAGPLFISGLNYSLNEKFSIKFETNYQFSYLSNWEDVMYDSAADNLNFLLSLQYTLNK